MQVRLADQMLQIGKPLLILRQQHQMVRLATVHQNALQVVPRRHVDLAPENRLQPVRLGPLVEMHPAVDIPVIRDRHGLLPLLLHPVHQRTAVVLAPVQRAKPVQKAVFRVQMQMGEFDAHASPPPPLYPIFPPPRQTFPTAIGTSVPLLFRLPHRPPPASPVITAPPFPFLPTAINANRLLPTAIASFPHADNAFANRFPFPEPPIHIHPPAFPNIRISSKMDDNRVETSPVKNRMTRYPAACRRRSLRRARR